MTIAKQSFLNHNQIFLETPPNPNLKMTVVIPCYNEPALNTLLQSLCNCKPTIYQTEIIVVINEPENASDNIIQRNTESVRVLEPFTSRNFEHLSFQGIYITLPQKTAGVGLARKIGMDEAFKRFRSVRKEKEGIIVCLDADCSVKSNYLLEIEHFYVKNPKTKAANIHFEHPLEGDLESSLYEGIAKYELHLRYYVAAQKFTGHPFAYQTVGSSMSVRADVYHASGGMNQRKAGEDFYFLQKIIPLGNFGEINTTTVIPSPRTSERVPFGTGKAMNNYLETNEIYSYDFRSFLELKKLFDQIVNLYHTIDCQIIIKMLHPCLVDFLMKYQFENNVKEIKSNISNYDNFRIRFFKWFDGFMVMKYVHFMRETAFPDKPIIDVANEFLNFTENTQEHRTEKDMLLKFRKLH
ncbi:MAG: glycosyltransferase family 2 protein [Bacteroidota bacterium]|nr:glycosyltransferase family 2 protein [Bacteroidota bacterium]